jgi:hypothetical protein
MGWSLAASSEAGKKGKLMNAPEQPTRMDAEEMSRLRQAAFRVTRLYPGPIGEIVSGEIHVWIDFGYRLGGTQLILRAVDHILKTPLEEGDAA